jgi:8-amino-7-oxononanoate synthase
MTLFDRWTETLDLLWNQNGYRALVTPAGIDFSSNDYLGYGRGRLSLLSSLARAGSQQARAMSGIGSRLLGGNHPIWEEVEEALARWHGAGAVLMMTSGYAANEGLLATIVDPDDWIASDERNHASIIDGLRLNRPERFLFRHNDLHHLEEGLRIAADRQPDAQRFVVTESLFSMDGDRAPLLEFARLAERYEAHLIVDEAHATGCFGPQGSGLVDEAGLRSRVLASVHTGGKALGVAGAYICGSALLKDYLVNRCRHLIYSTALPPLLGAFWLAAVSRVQQDEAGRQALRQNVECFRGELERLNLRVPGRDQIAPVVLGDDSRAVATALQLQKRGYDIRAIRFPTVPAGSAVLRLSLHADHDQGTLTQLAAELRDTLQP